MSTINSLVASNNFPLFIISVGFVFAGIIALGAAAFVSLRARQSDEG